MSVDIGELRKTVLFGALSDEELAAVAPVCSEEVFDRDGVVFNEDETATDTYSVISGQIIIRKMMAAQDAVMRQTMVRPYGPGDLFGWGAIFGGSYGVSAVARQRTSLLKVDARKLRHMMDENPSIGYKVMSAIAAKVAVSAADLQDALMAERALVVAEVNKRATRR